MPKHRQNNRKSKEERQRTDDERRGDDRSPCQHRYWICEHSPHRSHDGCGSAYIPIDEKRERDNAYREGQQCEEKTGADADEGESSALGSFEDLVNEAA